jgi:uncharacterized protein DUF4166
MSARLVELANDLPERRDADLHDARFRALLERDEWERLPAEVQKRFSKRLTGAQTAIYRGLVVDMHISRLGWILTQACRLFGAPLPLSREAGGAVIVTVSEDPRGGGQFWTRIYARKSGFPQVIHSAKRFAGGSGLEEYLGRGLGMALRLEGLNDGLAFVSDHYFLQIGGRRFRLPRGITPGTARITHRQIAGRTFLFELIVEHRRAGTLIHQQVLFDDVD